MKPLDLMRGKTPEQAAEIMRRNPHLGVAQGRATLPKSGGAARGAGSGAGARENVATGVLRVSIAGQVRGGKNSMQVSRTGHHYPNKLFAAWRDDAVAQVAAQIPAGWQPIDRPCRVVFDYRAGDRRVRDVPAVLDAVWHVLVKAGAVADDRWLGAAGMEYRQTLDRAAPGVEVTMETTKEST